MNAAVFAALGAAVCFAISAILQQGAALRAPQAKALRMALLVDLLHRPAWLLGFVAAAAGFGLQGLALHYGCLALVQPIILVNLVLALPIAARLHVQAVGPLQWVSGLVIAAGVALFLTVGSPRGGQPDAKRASFAVVACAFVAIVVLCVSVARTAGSRMRTILLAAAAGVLFGLLSAVLDAITNLLAHRGVAETLATWEPYLLALLAPAGELLAQSAYQAGPLAASSPTLNTVEPGSVIAVGIVVYGDHIVHTLAALVLEALAAACVIAGVIALARTAPRCRPPGIGAETLRTASR